MIDVVDNGSVPQLVIFDLDGTLYHRDRYIGPLLDVIGRMFVELQGATPEYAAKKVAELREPMRTDWARTSTTAFMLANGFEVEQWRDFREAHLSIVDSVHPDDQVVHDLKRLREVVPIALLTNNTRGSMEALLDKIGIAVADFTGVLSSEDVGQTPKPDPEAFRVLLGGFGVAAEHAWGVGDRHDIDIRPLRELGGAGIVVDGPSDLTAAVDYLIARVAPGRP